MMNARVSALPRRRSLQPRACGGLLLAIAFATLLPEFAHGAETRRPNILWLVADDHAAYVAGCYGNKIVRTPNLDRLAASGMRFDRAYCNSPVCTASRQSFLTGRYPRSVGVTLLSTPLPESEVTLAEMLKEAGYDTASFGKMHFNSQLKHGFDLRLDLADHAKALRARSAGQSRKESRSSPPGGLLRIRPVRGSTPWSRLSAPSTRT